MTDTDLSTLQEALRETRAMLRATSPVHSWLYATLLRRESDLESRIRQTTEELRERKQNEKR